MLFNANDINLSNYEEYFILYVDNELDAEKRSRVESFVSLHPHLAEELDILMSTKLPADAVSFHHKELLHAASMQMNFAEEELLLFVDGELPDAKKALVRDNINRNKEYARQYALLMKAKLDAAEMVPYPDKKELYRHTEKVAYFSVWMRVAVAIIVLLLGSLFFIMNLNKAASVNPPVTINPKQKQEIKKDFSPEQKNNFLLQQKEAPVLVKAPVSKKTSTAILKKMPLPDQKKEQVMNAIAIGNNNLPVKKEMVRLDVAHLTPQQSIINSLNKTITHTAVTSPLTASLHYADDPTEQDPSDGDFKPEKKTRAKGFLRKVSRFIQRNTGIGTVNADNELLVGVVALKLK